MYFPLFVRNLVGNKRLYSIIEPNLTRLCFVFRIHKSQKTMKDDVLWMGENEAVVNEVDPIRGLIKVTLATNVQLDVGPEELERKRPEPQKVSTQKKRRIPSCQESTPAPAPSRPPCEQDHKESPAALISVAEMNFEFSVIVQDDLLFKVGFLYFVDFCSFPFIITRLFKLSLSGSVFVSGVRCVIEGRGSCFILG